MPRSGRPEKASDKHCRLNKKCNAIDIIRGNRKGAIFSKDPPHSRIFWKIADPPTETSGGFYAIKATMESNDTVHRYYSAVDEIRYPSTSPNIRKARSLRRTSDRQVYRWSPTRRIISIFAESLACNKSERARSDVEAGTVPSVAYRGLAFLGSVRRLSDILRGTPSV